MSLVELARWAHLVAGAAWVGEVMVVAFVLGPALGAATPAGQVMLLESVYPRIFRLASVLVTVAFASGATLFLNRYGLWPVTATETAGGITLLIGGTLGAVIGVFHFLVEPLLERRIGDLHTADPERLRALVRFLRVVPRVGLLVLLSVTALMVASARGWLTA